MESFSLLANIQYTYKNSYAPKAGKMESSYHSSDSQLPLEAWVKRVMYSLPGSRVPCNPCFWVWPWSGLYCTESVKKHTRLNIVHNSLPDLLCELTTGYRHPVRDVAMSVNLQSASVT